MAKVYFFYSVMNAGKTTLLLQSRHNYESRGMRTLCLKPALDTRDQAGLITSRIGLEAPCRMLGEHESLLRAVRETVGDRLSCVLIDEAQFLSAGQTNEVFDACDELDVPILCFGLRSDFLGQPFEASALLMARADSLVELKTVCHCGKKATMNMRIDPQGRPVYAGEKVLVGGNDAYIPVCRRHYKEGQAVRHTGD